MHIAVRLLAIFLFCGIAIPDSWAQGDVADGEKLAREVCSRCHNVEPGGPFKQYPPSFAAIAAYRSAEDIRWRILAPPLHASMPRVAALFNPGNIDSLVAYIVSLENQ